MPVYLAVIMLISVIGFVACTTEKNSEPVNSKNLKTSNDLFQSFKKQLNLNSNAEILSLDNEKPRFFNNYLRLKKTSQDNLEDFYHLKIDTKTQNGIVDFYTVKINNSNSNAKLNSEQVNYLTFVESEPEINGSFYFEITFEFNGDNTITLISSNEPTILSEGKKSWSKCFGTCMNAALDNSGLLGQVITIGGIAGSLGCSVCGAVAGTYAATAALGCAGGCI